MDILANVDIEYLKAISNSVLSYITSARVYDFYLSLLLYNNLTEIDLCNVSITNIPKEFSRLSALQICALSRNKIREIPFCIIYLQQLKTLHLDSNFIEYLPIFLNALSNLVKLDVYDNEIDYVSCNLDAFDCLDIAYNFIDEPDSIDYCEKKRLLRSQLKDISRKDGCKLQSNYGYFERSSTNSKCVSPDDTEFWDTDENWDPVENYAKPSSSIMLNMFINKRINDGHFCPIDLHPRRVHSTDRNTTIESGQFDDASSDE